MTLMLLPDDKYLFFGIDLKTTTVANFQRFFNEWMSRSSDPAAFATFGIKMVIDARVTPAIAINIKE